MTELEQESTPFKYQHATVEDHTQFLTGRLRALEVEHLGFALLVSNARDDTEKKRWQVMLDECTHNIETLRKGLASLA